MKRSILHFVVLLVFLAGAFAAYSENGQPKMVLEKGTFDAGEIYRSGNKIEHAFTIKNKGTGDLKIFNVEPG